MKRADDRSANEASAVAPLVVDAFGLADMLLVSRSTILKLDSSGRIPNGVCLGRRKVWPIEEIREWLRAGAPTRERWEARR